MICTEDDSFWMLFQRSMITGKRVFVGTFLLHIETTSFDPSFPLSAFLRSAISCLDPMNDGTTSINVD